MTRLLLSLTLLVSTVSANATEIQLRPGSSAKIRAGDEATVTCGGGGGGGGGHRDRCQCVVGQKAEHSAIPCSEAGRYGYVLLIAGVPVASDGCWNSSGGTNGQISAGHVCRKKMKEFDECK
jgi:hypothetical protein